jgi:hypothetical protein
VLRAVISPTPIRDQTSTAAVSMGRRAYCQLTAMCRPWLLAWRRSQPVARDWIVKIREFERHDELSYIDPADW